MTRSEMVGMRVSKGPEALIACCAAAFAAASLGCTSDTSVGPAAAEPGSAAPTHDVSNPATRPEVAAAPEGTSSMGTAWGGPGRAPQTAPAPNPAGAGNAPPGFPTGTESPGAGNQPTIGPEHQLDAGSATGNDASAPDTEKSPADDPRTPPDVARSWHQWPLPGKDYSNTRYTRDSPITSKNVDQLSEAWRVELPGLVIAYGLCSTVPIIVDGTVYIEDLSSSVRAIDLKSGRVKWAVQEANLNPGPNGVAVGWGKVFAIRGSDSVVAFDAETGEELWNKRVIDTATAGIDIQPTVFDGQVLVSTVPISTRGIYVAGDRGILKSLDQETGEERWRFDTIASPDDVWGDSGVNSGGGSWFPPSIDVESGRVFWAVANPAPFPGTRRFPNGSSRPGDNLYSDATLALDVRDGSYQWHHQTIQHDLFDRDLLHTMLTTVGDVPVVVSTGKEGRVWANRRDTGELLWGPTSVGVHMNDELSELSDTTRVLPGSFGGVLTPPALAEGAVYVATLNAPTTYQPDRTAYFGSEIGTMNGNLVAIDVATGDILWDTTVEGDPTGGVTVINDLVITATFQGKVFAYQRATGQEVWNWTAPGGINSWLSVAGDMLIIPVGSSVPAVVVALHLGGDGTEPGSTDPGDAPDDGSASPAAPGTFSAIYQDILAPKCAGPVCHGTESTGGSLVVDGSADASAVRATLINRAPSGSECGTADLPLVVPGNPDRSLLYRKLSDNPPCGARMPPTGALTADELTSIRTWIQDGAP